MNKITKNIVVLYDSGCFDGFSGAWIAWKKFKNRAVYIPVKHENPPPKGLKNKEIYLIDFTYPVKVIQKFIKENKRVTAIDHHKTAEKATKLTYKYSYSTEHSGSFLAWKYFYPKKSVPIFLKYVEDMDLWRLKMPYIREIGALIESFELNFKTWDKIVQDFENSKKRKEFIEKGKVVLKYENKLVRDLVFRNAEKVEFVGYKTLAVNTPNWPSEIGHLLIKKMPPIGITWSKKKDKFIISLRSDGTVDVGKIAQRFGGGGHKKAAGFSIPGNKKLPWKPLF